MPIEPTPAATPEEQQSMDLINHQRTTLLADLLPTEPTTADSGPALEDASEWLTNSRILVYLRASKGDHNQAISRLRATLEWRATYRPYAITPAMMRTEGATGKMYVNGYDRGGRPLVYMFPHRENTSDAKDHLRYIVFTMEQALRAMAPGVTKLTIILDASMFSPLAHSVPLSTAREFLSVLEKHYPDRLFKALVLSPPAYFVVFYRIVAPFIDPVTKSKIAFVDLAGEKGRGSVDGAW
ncbi:Phosphatidylinositol transfer protein (PITP), partial [Coemansia sp. RSA 2424]